MMERFEIEAKKVRPTRFFYFSRNWFFLLKMAHLKSKFTNFVTNFDLIVVYSCLKAYIQTALTIIILHSLNITDYLLNSL
jgi:hypothetical protein